MRLHESVEIMSAALQSLRHGNDLPEDVAGSSILKEWRCIESGKSYFVRQNVCLILGQISEVTEKAEPSALTEPSTATVSGKGLSGKWLATFVEFLR